METQAENSAKGMTTTLATAPLYLRYVTEIHSNNDFHAALPPILKYAYSYAFRKYYHNNTGKHAQLLQLDYIPRAS